jgi:hypothetical protein
MSDADAPTSKSKPPLGPLPWIVLALWIAWLAALVVMSRGEWGKAKPAHAPAETTEPVPGQKQLEPLEK